MSVLVKGMEMPKRCGVCPLYHYEYPMHCMAVKNYRTVGAPYGMPRPDWCPLVEVKTPHGKLIDEDELFFPALSRSYDNEIVRDILGEAPTVIEAEVEE